MARLFIGVCRTMFCVLEPQRLSDFTDFRTLPTSKKPPPLPKLK